MLHINIYENRSTGSRDQNFMALYHIWAMKPSDHVTNIILTYFISLFLKAQIQNLVKKGQVFLRKTSFNFDIKLPLAKVKR